MLLTWTILSRADLRSKAVLHLYLTKFHLKIFPLPVTFYCLSSSAFWLRKLCLKCNTEVKQHAVLPPRTRGISSIDLIRNMKLGLTFPLLLTVCVLSKSPFPGYQHQTPRLPPAVISAQGSCCHFPCLGSFYSVRKLDVLCFMIRSRISHTTVRTES